MTMIVVEDEKFRPEFLLSRGKLEPDTSKVSYDQGRANVCGMIKGHVLQIKDGVIVCINCPARWKNYGF